MIPYHIICTFQWPKLCSMPHMSAPAQHAGVQPECFTFCSSPCALLIHSQPHSTSFCAMQVNSANETSAGAGGTGDTASGAPAATKQGWPKRLSIVVLCFVAFMLCNMDRVNMSIAILPMQQEFGWTPQIVGIVQSSFFWCAVNAICIHIHAQTYMCYIAKTSHAKK